MLWLSWGCDNIVLFHKILFLCIKILLDVYKSLFPLAPVVRHTSFSSHLSLRSHNITELITHELAALYPLDKGTDGGPKLVIFHSDTDS